MGIVTFRLDLLLFALADGAPEGLSCDLLGLVQGYFWPDRGALSFSFDVIEFLGRYLLILSLEREFSLSIFSSVKPPF